MDKIRKIYREYKKCANWLFRNAKPFIGKLIIIYMCNILISILGLGISVTTKDLIDASVSARNISGVIVIYLIIILVSQLLKVIKNLISVTTNEKFTFKIRLKVFQKILNSDWLAIEKYHTGDLFTRLSNDTDNVASGIVDVIPTIVQLLIEVIIMFFALFYYEPLLAIIAGIIAPIASLCCFWLGRKLHTIQKKIQETVSAYNSLMQESLSNILIVKSFCSEDETVEHLNSLRKERFHWIWKKNIMMLVSSSLISLSFNLSFIAALGYGAYRLSQNSISYGMVTFFITMVSRIQSPIFALSNTIPKLVSIATSANRVIELQAIPLERKSEVILSPKAIGVKLHKVSFGYDQKTIIEQAEMSIQPSEFVAILGESGIGKTTLIRLIMGFIKEKAGTIVFSDENGNTDEANASTRRLTGYVPQGNSLFSGSIRDNIKLGCKDASDFEIVKALKVADGYEFVSKLPEGLDTIIGEKGVGISEGQAQRIAIARAIITNAPLLILDEATSALDEQTELNVLEGLKQLKPRPACLVITHRKSILAYCNRQIYIENKKFVTSGLAV